jgi:Xaa-Pro dipeptidase
MNLQALQAAISAAGFDGWLFYDHHHRDPIAHRVLGLSPHGLESRRWFYFIPAHGEPRKLVHRIESFKLDTLPGQKRAYSSWQELAAGIAAILSGANRIAMQYSPNNAIVYVSMVDAGTVEYLRSIGKEIVSSADLVSQFEAVLTEAQKQTHDQARIIIDGIVAEAWLEIRRRLNSQTASSPAFTEYDLKKWLGDQMRSQGITWQNGPDVSVNQNTSDSHYDPTPEHCTQIKDGDFLLIDIWGRLDDPPQGAPSKAATKQSESDKISVASVYYDITWTAVIGREPTEIEQKVFSTVTAARDAAISTVEKAFAANRPIHGYEADDAARRVIIDAGFAEYFTHRTGHNIGNEIHGTGANLDNLETHDERLILPNTCFSVEPGIYLPEFGVRSEIDMLTAPGKAWVTGKIQRELVRV